MSATFTPYVPWTDRRGHLDAFKLAVFAACLLPAGLLLFNALAGALGPKPVTAAIRNSGDWTIRFIAIGLAITPLRLLVENARLIAVRRMIGVSAMGYALIHVSLYVVDQKFDAWRIASEIVLRFYLLIGFTAVLGLIALGATSTDNAIKRMGAQAWKRLHLIVYPIAVLGLWHFFLQSKTDVSEPVLMTGLVLVLLGVRLLKRWRWQDRIAALVALAVAAALLTAAIEIAWYGLFTGVPAARVFHSQLDFSYVVRPAWWVLASALTLPAARLAMIGWARWKEPGRTTAQA